MVSLVAVGALAALGGTYPSSTVPLFIASAAAFLLSGARVAASRATRALDLALLAFAAGILLQIVPLPDALVARLSPGSSSLQSMLQLQPSSVVRPLSIDGHLTRTGLATAGAAILLFWAVRETAGRGGLRATVRTIALAGLVVSFVGLVQRVTAPASLLWRWTPLDPTAQPFGPFVNRNHFATWLLMAGALVAGYLVANIRSHRFTRHTPARLVAHDLLADGGAILLAGSLGMMLLALAGTLSRAGLLGAVGAAAFGITMGRRRERHDRAILISGVALAAMLAGALWVNREGLVRRLDASLSSDVGRPVIWTETLPIVRDFWTAGTGIGTYGQAMLRYQRTQASRFFNQAHSEYLQLLAEGGLLVSVPAAIAIWQWVRLARRRLAQDAGEHLWIRVGAVAGLCGVAVQSLFENGLRMGANALLFALVAAIVIHEPRSTGGSTERRLTPPTGRGELPEAPPGGLA